MTRQGVDLLGQQREILDQIFEQDRNGLEHDFIVQVGKRVGPRARKAIQALEIARQATSNSGDTQTRSDDPQNVGPSRTTLTGNQYHAEVVAEGQKTATKDTLTQLTTGGRGRRTVATFMPGKREVTVDSFSLFGKPIWAIRRS